MLSSREIERILSGFQDETNDESLRPILMDLNDDDLYQIAWAEINQRRGSEGRWARLFVENDGDETKTRVAYIKLRVEDLQKLRKAEIDEVEKTEQAELEEQRKQAEAERLEIEHHLKEEEQLLEKLRNTSPKKPPWFRFHFTGGHDLDVDIVLGFLSAGVDPKDLIGNITTTGDNEEADSLEVEELNSLLTIAARLWDKGMLTKKGVSAHPHAPL